MRAVVIKRPWVHHTVILAYLLAPIAAIVPVMLAEHAAPGGAVGVLFRELGVLATLWLLTAPVVGVALYFVHRLSWYAFLAHGGILLAGYAARWAAEPELLLQTMAGLRHLLLLTGNLVVLLVIGYILQRDFRSPYFQVLPRSWRESKRVPIHHDVMVEGRKARTSDLSTGGCFLAREASRKNGGALSLSVGARVTVEFDSHTLHLTVRAEVMRVTPEGCGLRFLSLTRAQRRDLARLLANRFALRYKVDLPAAWRIDQATEHAYACDVSLTGCYLGTSSRGKREGTPGWVTIRIDSTEFRTRGRIVWVNPGGVHQKPEGFAVRFLRLQHGLISQIRTAYGGRLEPTR